MRRGASAISSSSGYCFDASNSGGSNTAASDPSFIKTIIDRAGKEKILNPHSNGLIPMEILTASASGLDPEITILAAKWQIKRVAMARLMPEDIVLEAVMKVKEGELFGFIGPERVNVLKLNTYLDTLSVK